jgi:hypothetical protein
MSLMPRYTSALTESTAPRASPWTTAPVGATNIAGEPLEAALIDNEPWPTRVTVASLRCRSPLIKVSTNGLSLSLRCHRTQPHRSLATVAQARAPLGRGGKGAAVGSVLHHHPPVTHPDRPSQHRRLRLDLKKTFRHIKSWPCIWYSTIEIRTKITLHFI